MSVGNWIPARIDRALRAAAAWASDPDVGTESVRRWAVLGAQIVVCAAVWGARALGRRIRRERGVVVLVLALAIPVAALEFRSHPGARPTNGPAVRPASARVTENEPAAGGIDESAEENARMAAWKRSVEQALTQAEGAGATAVRSLAAQEAEARRINLGFAQELGIAHAESLNENNEDKGAGEAKAASGSGVAKETNAADEAKRANETKGSEQSSDSASIASGQDRQTLSTDRVDGWSRRTDNFGAMKETDDRDVAREYAVVRHALVYSWVTVDRAGHRWVHIRPLHYSQR
jgi:hypothetical protein